MDPFFRKHNFVILFNNIVLSLKKHLTELSS